MIFDDVLDLAKKVSKYTIAGEGNVSIRDGDTMLIKASGSTLETMTDEDLAVSYTHLTLPTKQPV